MGGSNPNSELPSAPIETLVKPFKVFAANKISGAILLVSATVAALIWANSPWGDSYRALWQQPVTVGVADFVLSKPLLLWINDGLMAMFFFLVGLEIKREVLAGELASIRKATLPLAGAVGGMLVPAGIFLIFNTSGPGQHGWGIPMATDIAFALGILALLGDRVPLGLKVFLTALAIVDDIGAILVIAVFYTDSLSLVALGVGGAGLVLAILSNRLGVRNAVFYFLIGLVVWLAFLKSGVHATLAAVLMAFTIPARTRIRRQTFVDRTRGLLDTLESEIEHGQSQFLTKTQQNLLDETERAMEATTAPLQRLEHALEPLVTYAVMPIFALANAGVVLGGDIGAAVGDPVFLGILAGLFVGKQLGIFGGAWLAVRLGLAELPAGVGWRQVHGVAILGGVGFTMALFIGGLAFASPQLQDVSKLGILSASLLSAVVGWALLRFSPNRTGVP